MISELSLQRGMPIDIGICKVYPLSLDEIVHIGDFMYSQYLSAIMIDRNVLNTDGIKTPEQIEEFNKITPFKTLHMVARNDEFRRQLFIQALSVFTRDSVSYHDADFFYFGEFNEHRVLNEEAFELIRLIIQKQNYIEVKEEKQFKPANDKTKEILEKMKKAKEKIQKQKKDDSIGLSDIVSIVATYSNVDILNVWNLTIYQLYEIYLRIILWDEYHNSYTLLPHVSDQSSLNLKHWTSKLNK